LRWEGTHVFQAKMLPPVEQSFKSHSEMDLYELSNYGSPYSRDKEEVRKDNLQRIRSVLKMSMENETETKELDDDSWKQLEDERGDE
jgi:hypothetical protein